MLPEINNYFFISPESEVGYSNSLVENSLSILKDWIDINTILVSCNPLYSNRITQLFNHKISFLSNHTLLETLELRFPELNTNQVWNGENYISFDTYIKDFFNKNRLINEKIVFISDYVNDNYLNKIILNLKNKNLDYKFISLFQNSNSKLKLDIVNNYIEKPPLYWWENSNIKK